MKRRWFDKGVHALQRYYSEPVPGYVCPLCLTVFPEDRLGDLTKEHVPQKALGGRVLVLTCTTCNSAAGGKNGVDTHARREQNVWDFALGTAEAARPVQLSVADVTVSAEVHSHGGGLMIVGRPADNDPRLTDHLSSELDAMTAPNSRPRLTLTLHRDAYSRSCAAVSWLRTAYLVAFAQFGYRYIFQRNMEPVREQIKDPAHAHLPMFRFTIPGAAKTARALFLVSQPEWVRALGVQCGRNVVLLPQSNSDDGLYDRIRKNGNSGDAISFTSSAAWEWPRTACYLFDPA